jgi:hypothetical protein
MFFGRPTGNAAAGGGGGGLTAAAIDAAPAAAAVALADHLPASQAGTLVYETPQQLFNAISLLASAGALAGANLLPVTQVGIAKSLSLTILQAAFGAAGGLPLAGFLVGSPATAAANTVKGSADVVPLTVKRFQAGSNSDLFQFLDQAGVILSRIDKNGSFFAQDSGGSPRILLDQTTGQVIITNNLQAQQGVIVGDVGGNRGGISTGDTRLTRIAAGVWSIDGPTSADRLGWIADTGRRRASAQFDATASTALANVPGLSVAVQAGRTYSFEAALFVTPDAVGGAKYAIAGTATATAIIYEITHVSDTGNSITIASRQTALGGSAGAGGAGTGLCRIKGLITVNAAGTLTVQFAQNAANGTSSVLAGSDFLVLDNP